MIASILMLGFHLTVVFFEVFNIHMPNLINGKGQLFLSVALIIAISYIIFKQILIKNCRASPVTGLSEKHTYHPTKAVKIGVGFLYIFIILVLPVIVAFCCTNRRP